MNLSLYIEQRQSTTIYIFTSESCNEGTFPGRSGNNLVQDLDISPHPLGKLRPTTQNQITVCDLQICQVTRKKST